MKKKPESFNVRANGVINEECILIEVSNYGEKKTSFKFYTRSATYAEYKMEYIKGKYPGVVFKVSKGKIIFKKTEGV